MSDLGDELRGFTAQVEFYDELSNLMRVAGSVDKLELEILNLKRDVENLVRERDLHLRKLDEIRRFADATNDTVLKSIVGQMMSLDD